MSQLQGQQPIAITRNSARTPARQGIRQGIATPGLPTGPAATNTSDLDAVREALVSAASFANTAGNAARQAQNNRDRKRAEIQKQIDERVGQLELEAFTTGPPNVQLDRPEFQDAVDRGVAARMFHDDRANLPGMLQSGEFRVGVDETAADALARLITEQTDGLSEASTQQYAALAIKQFPAIFASHLKAKRITAMANLTDAVIADISTSETSGEISDKIKAASGLQGNQSDLQHISRLVMPGANAAANAGDAKALEPFTIILRENHLTNEAIELESRAATVKAQQEAVAFEQSQDRVAVLTREIGDPDSSTTLSVALAEIEKMPVRETDKSRFADIVSGQQAEVMKQRNQELRHAIAGEIVRGDYETPAMLLDRTGELVQAGLITTGQEGTLLSSLNRRLEANETEEAASASKIRVSNAITGNQPGGDQPVVIVSGDEQHLYSHFTKGGVIDEATNTIQIPSRLSAEIMQFSRAGGSIDAKTKSVILNNLTSTDPQRRLAGIQVAAVLQTAADPTYLQLLDDATPSIQNAMAAISHATELGMFEDPATFEQAVQFVSSSLESTEPPANPRATTDRLSGRTNPDGSIRDFDKSGGQWVQERVNTAKPDYVDDWFFDPAINELTAGLTRQIQAAATQMYASQIRAHGVHEKAAGVANAYAEQYAKQRLTYIRWNDAVTVRPMSGAGVTPIPEYLRWDGETEEAIKTELTERIPDFDPLLWQPTPTKDGWAMADATGLLGGDLLRDDATGDVIVWTPGRGGPSMRAPTLKDDLVGAILNRASAASESLSTAGENLNEAAGGAFKTLIRDFRQLREGTFRFVEEQLTTPRELARIDALRGRNKNE